MLYPGLMLLILAAYGALIGNRWYGAGSLGILACWLIVLGGRGYRVLRIYVAGLDQISLGMACLLAGLIVSLCKLGIPQTWMSRWLKPRASPLVLRAARPKAAKRPLTTALSGGRV